MPRERELQGENASSPKSISSVIYVVLLCLATTAAFIGILRTGYIHDDAWSRHIYAILSFHHINLGQWFERVTIRVMVSQGRLNFGAIVAAVAPFLVFKSLLTFKVFVLSSIVFSLIMFYRLMVEIVGVRALAFLACILTLSCMQIRLAFDPFVGFSGMLQVLSVILFFSLERFAHYLRTGSRISYMLSLLVFATGLMTYEVFAPLVCAYVGLAVRRSSSLRNALKSTFPFLLLVSLFVALSCCLKAIAAPGISYGVSLNPAAVLSTFLIQVTGALPLSYCFAGNWDCFSLANVGTYTITLFAGFVFIAVVAVSSFAAIRDLEETESIQTIASRPLMDCLLLGTALFVLPALALSICTKYQGHLKPGIPHIPVYFQYFGTGTLLALLMFTVYQRASLKHAGLIRCAMVTLVSLLAICTFASNTATLKRYEPWYANVTTVEHALAHGLCKNVPDGSNLTFSLPNTDSSLDSWQNTYFFYTFSGKRLQVVSVNPNANPLPAWSLTTKTPEPLIYVLGLQILSRNKGCVWLESKPTSGGNGEFVTKPPVVLFVQSSSLKKKLLSASDLRNLVSASFKSARPEKSIAQRTALVSVEDCGEDWVLFDIDQDGDNIGERMSAIANLL
jgi:hypothetical protein